MVADSVAGVDCTWKCRFLFGSCMSTSLGGVAGRFGGNFSSSYFLDGNLDELGVWNSALTSAEIVQIYNSGAPIDLTEDSGNYASSSDLIHYYRCGDGDTYPTIEDNAGSNDLTMTNMASGDIVEVVPSA